MNNKEYGVFIVKIIETLKKNGFPAKRVSLPLEKMYEVAFNKGLNFNKVLEFLKEKNIDHEKTPEKIIFFEKQESSSDNQFDPSKLFEMFNQNAGAGAGANMSHLIEKAQEMIQTMPKDQVESMLKLFNNMPEDQKADIMKKARDLGLL